MTTSQSTMDEQERLHRQRCAEWFQQMYGRELEDTFGLEPKNHTQEDEDAAE